MGVQGQLKDLQKAYNQLNDYREELGNPPLLVVRDLERFEVHTNLTATKKRIYAFNPASCSPKVRFIIELASSAKSATADAVEDFGTLPSHRLWVPHSSCVFVFCG